jgi:Cu+-exporting ATPase
MDPEVRQQGPGACPKCGMALEPLDIGAALTKAEYTCPMHPEIIRDAPGACPLCGMALEVRTVTMTEETNPELDDMTRRFWVGAALSIPVLLVAMSDMLPGQPLHRMFSPRTLIWFQFLFSTPVVLWCGWPFFRARMDVGGQSQSEHVHADRDGCWHGLWVQFGGDANS